MALLYLTPLLLPCLECTASLFDDWTREKNTAKQAINPKGTEKTYEIFKFPQATKAGGRLYVSGQIGVGRDGVVPTDPTKQFELAFKAVTNVLKEAGLSWDDVVEMTTYHVDLRTHIRAFSKVHSQYVTEPYPSWTAIGTTELIYPDALVEIRVIAHYPATG